MKYLFILGRNVDLSLAELQAFFDKEGNEIINYTNEENSVLVDLERSIDSGVVDKLGGTISIGQVICEIDEMEKTMIYEGEENNFSYALWNYSDRYDEVSEYLKKRFRSEKLKASEKKLTGNIEMQNGEKIPILESKSVREQYFVFGDHFGKIIQTCDYESLEKRDMEKPVRRESLAISPRLAKIMINLSKVQDNGKLVDAFCGIGVILEEALLRGVEVVGVDKDKAATLGAKENLKWFGFDENKYRIVNFDSKRVNIPKVDVMVSEPDLGTTLKKIPTKEKAQTQINKFEKLIIGVVNNMKDYVDSRFVFTAPLIRIGKKRIGCNPERIAEETGLKLALGFPIKEFRGNQIVGRDIFVLDKE